MQRPEINYPTIWSYRVIGLNSVELRADINERLGDLDFKLEDSNQSRSGRFISLIVTLTVDSESMRNSIFQDLNDIAHVHMVL